MVDFQRIWNWYSRESVQKALIEVAQNREVVSVFQDGAYGKRPDVIQYQADVVQAVAEGTVAFHGSVERWVQPMKLDVGMTKADLDNLRQGWDIFIDPDVKDFEIAKITTRQIVETLKDHGVNSFSVKFSGGSGFHIGIPFESLPEKINFQSSSSMYPDLLYKIIEYIKWYSKDQLKEDLLAVGNPTDIARRIEKPLAEITNAEGMDPFKVVSMDVFSSRHLFRLPYSLHEKNLLVSLPIKINDMEKFDKEQAKPEKVKVDERFLVPRVSIHDAEALVVESLDWASKHLKETREELPKPKFLRKIRMIPEMYFPPCIKDYLLKGLKDGRKRSVFILINFLRNMGWDIDKVEKALEEWNQKNYPPLRTNYLRGQLRWHFRQDRNLLPPNCDNAVFYDNTGLCHPDAICDNKKIKNPVNYPFKKMKRTDKLKIKK